MHDALPPAISAQLSRACAVLDRHLADNLIALHVLGSAVGGGLKPSSDIDLLGTVDVPPGEATRRNLMTSLLTVSAPPGSGASLRPLEVTVLARPHVVPWRYPARRELQFGEWLRADLLAGRFEDPVLDHDLAILLTQARLDGVCLKGPEAGALFDPVPGEDLFRALLDTVAQWNAPEDWAGDERNTVLALARVWYTAAMGRIASKDVAAAWLMDRDPGPHRAILDKARAAYLGEGRDDLAARPEDVAAFVRHARRAIERLCGGRR